MAKAQYSTIYKQTVDQVWRAISSFKKYEWGEGVEPGIIEDGRHDNEGGSIRAFLYYGSPARQRLTAYSADERTQSWEPLEPYEDIRHYEVTLTLGPHANGGSGVIWKVDFDAPAERSEYWSTFFRDEFEKSLSKLGNILDRGSV